MGFFQRGLRLIYVTKFETQFEYCEESSCVEKAFQRRRLASMIGAEGLHQVGASIAVIRMLFDLGVRYITLTHNCNNPFATSATHVAAGGFDDGLTEVGEAAVLEMNRLGMMVDLSHVSVKTMEDALAVSRSPVLFSHSAARALSNHSRNVPDHILHQLRTNGGIVMITFVAPFLNAQYPQDATVETVVDHIYHVANEAGWKHVGIGSDFDGIADWPPGLNDTSCYPNLVRSLLRRGASDEQVKLVMGQNILRVWRENEQRSASLRSQALLPREDTVPGRYFGLRFG